MSSSLRNFRLRRGNEKGTNSDCGKGCYKTEKGEEGRLPFSARCVGEEGKRRRAVVRGRKWGRPLAVDLRNTGRKE